MNHDYSLDFLLWFVLIVGFCAYVGNAQGTTLTLGKLLSEVDNEKSTGLQDALTPRWQQRNNLIMFAGLAGYLAACFFVFKWYLAIAMFLATFFVAIPLASRFMVPKPMSGHYLTRIRRDLEERAASFDSQGDSVRANAVRYLLERFKSEIPHAFAEP